MAQPHIIFRVPAPLRKAFYDHVEHSRVDVSKVMRRLLINYLSNEGVVLTADTLEEQEQQRPNKSGEGVSKG